MDSKFWINIKYNRSSQENIFQMYGTYTDIYYNF